MADIDWSDDDQVQNFFDDDDSDGEFEGLNQRT
jgi:hypothetical protein